LARSLRSLARPWKGRPALWLAAGLLLAGGLTACSGSHVVASGSQQFYATVPSGWKVFDSSSLTHDNSLHSLISTRPEFLEVASASPRARAADAFTSSRYPWAIALVRPLSKAEQSQLSLESLSDVLVPVDELSQLGDSVTLLSQPTEQVNGPLHGIVLSVQLQGPSGGEIAYEQSAWVNGATSKVWLLMVGCSPSCFQQQQSVVSNIMSSFLVTNNKGK
jgi:hypothetical protein